jgi:NAD(P)-dependent dehydrogenase (short-subunit alcohol dehydrogenase family)
MQLKPNQGMGVALVTGAGRGLGAEISVALAEAGADVVVASRTRSELEQVANRIVLRGGRARVLVCDVTDGASVRAGIESLERLDVLVNNAGTIFVKPFVEVSEETLDKQIDLNVRGTFLVAQAAVRKMLEAPDRKERGGVVINMSSQLGHVGLEGRTAYCMTKHAIEGLTKAMAVEFGPHNIRVNSIAPTFVETPMTLPRLSDPAFREWVTGKIPLGRIGRIADVTDAIIFLASSASSLMTGTSLVIDGGWTAQ